MKTISELLRENAELELAHPQVFPLARAARAGDDHTYIQVCEAVWRVAGPERKPQVEPLNVVPVNPREE